MSEKNIYLDEALHDDHLDLLVGKRVLEAVTEKDGQGKALTELVRTGGGTRGPDLETKKYYFHFFNLPRKKHSICEISNLHDQICFFELNLLIFLQHRRACRASSGMARTSASYASWDHAPWWKNNTELFSNRFCPVNRNQLSREEQFQPHKLCLYKLLMMPRDQPDQI